MGLTTAMILKTIFVFSEWRSNDELEWKTKDCLHCSDTSRDKKRWLTLLEIDCSTCVVTFYRCDIYVCVLFSLLQILVCHSHHLTVLTMWRPAGIHGGKKKASSVLNNMWGFITQNLFLIHLFIHLNTKRIS